MSEQNPDTIDAIEKILADWIYKRATSRGDKDTLRHVARSLLMSIPEFQNSARDKLRYEADIMWRKLLEQGKCNSNLREEIKSLTDEIELCPLKA